MKEVVFKHWSCYMTDQAQTAETIVALLEDGKYEEADKKLNEAIQLLSLTRGWILNNKGRKASRCSAQSV